MPTKSLQSMVWPLVVSFTLRFLFTFVDLSYAAVLDDDNAAVAAIGFYLPLGCIYIAVWVGLSAGFTAALSSAFGHRDEVRISALKRTMLGILGVLIPALMLLGVGVYLVSPHLGLEPRAAEAFRIYATTLAIGMPVTGFWSIYPDSVVKAHQATRDTMVAGLASTAANVALNTWFVFGLGWGIFGIALATVVSRLAGLWYAMWRARALELQRLAGPAYDGTAPAEPTPLAMIMRLSVPGGLTHILAAVEASAINRVLVELPDSTRAIASWAVYEKMLALAIMPAAAASVAVVPYIALLLPRGEIDRIRRELRQTVLAIVGAGLVMTLCMGWVFAEPLAGFFVSRGDVDPESAPEVSALTLHAIALLPLGVLGAAPFFILRPVFEAAHRPGLGVRASLVRYLVLSLPLLITGALLAPQLGFSGLHGMIGGLIAASALASIWVARLANRVLAADAVTAASDRPRPDAG